MSDYTVKKHHLSPNGRGAYTYLLEGNDLTKYVDTDIFNVVSDLNQELATQAAALEAQSATIAELRLKVQHQQEGLDSYIKRLQDANEKAAHHAELVRIASETAARYEAAITDAIGRIAFSPFEALQILKRALTETSEEIEESESAK